MPPSGKPPSRMPQGQPSQLARRMGFQTADIIRAQQIIRKPTICRAREPGRSRHAKTSSTDAKIITSRVRNAWAPAETREPAARPAWLSSRGPAQTRRRQQRWRPRRKTLCRHRATALLRAGSHSMDLFSGGTAAAEAVPAAAAAQRAPVPGGVFAGWRRGQDQPGGHTGAYVVGARGAGAAGGHGGVRTFPFYFGARDQRPGVLRTFTAPSTSGDAPVQMITVDPDSLGPEGGTQESLPQEISRHSRGAGAGDRGPRHRFRRRYASGAADVAHGAGTRGARHELGGKR